MSFIKFKFITNGSANNIPPVIGSKVDTKAKL